MKTKLEIEEGLKPYLVMEKNLNTVYYQWLFKFENGYGASIIKRAGSYGFEQDLFELASIKWHEDKWELCSLSNEYEVKGYLTNEEVMKILFKIKKLRKKRRKKENVES